MDLLYIHSIRSTLQGTNISHLKVAGKTIFLFHRWDILVLRRIYIYIYFYHIVDGRNPAPPGMFKTLCMMGCLPYQLVQDFFHQSHACVCVYSV